MTSPIGAVLTQITTDWEALTPNDRPTSPYRAMSRSDMRESSIRDRRFEFGPPVFLETLGTTADGSLSQVRAETAAILHSRPDRYTLTELATELANDVSQLRGAVEARTAWPSGVLYVTVREAIPNATPDGLLEYRMTLETITEEPNS